MAGYAKFETFPVWNLPLDHPVNLAYEGHAGAFHQHFQLEHHVLVHSAPEFAGEGGVVPAQDLHVGRLWPPRPVRLAQRV